MASNSQVPYQGPIAPSISIGKIPFPETGDTAIIAQVDSSYSDYMIMSRYESDGCRYMLGITSPSGFQGKSVAIVQLASPTLLWIADFTACRINAQPEVPDPTPFDPNWVILDAFFETAMITVVTDGSSPVYRISGTYVYGHLMPATNTLNNIAYPRPPWLENTFIRTVSTSVLERYLIDTQTRPANGGPTGFPTR